MFQEIYFIHMFTRANFIGLVNFAYARYLQIQALFQTSERQPLTAGIKPIGSGRYVTWSIWPSIPIPVIPGFPEGFGSQFLPPDIVIDKETRYRIGQ